MWVLLGLPFREWKLWRTERAQPRFRLEQWDIGRPNLPAYPIDLSPLLALPFGHLDETGVPYNTTNGDYGGAYQPTTIAQYGLAQWNAYLHDGDEARLQSFMIQAHWLLANETRLANGSSVWPIPFPAPQYGAQDIWLSALTQGNAISVLVRAYRVTGDAAFLAAARRAVQSFETDILDGGVSAPVGSDGIFFEEVATYPAARILNGYLLALFGLYDYVDLTGDEGIKTLADKSVQTLHTLLPGYDMGYWSRYDLLHKKPVNRFYHALHVTLLEALAHYTGCAHCEALAKKWAGYERSLSCRARYYLTSRTRRYRTGLARVLRTRNAPKTPAPDGRLRVCVPITAFPVAGGMRGVLFGVDEVMGDAWRMEYLTRYVGPDRQGRDIASFEWRHLPFGPETTSPMQFPNVWFYGWAGRRTLARRLRQRAYDVLLPQDGVFTAAFTARANRRIGLPIVTMDHGNVTLPFDPRYPLQRRQEFAQQPLPKRLLSIIRFSMYRRALLPLLRYATRHADRFLVAGDEVEESYRQRLGVLPDRIIRYPYRVDVSHFLPPSAAASRRLREQLGIPADALVVTMINRLAPEKGLDTAIEGIARSAAQLPDAVRSRLRVIIAGDGPLRAALTADIARRGLQDMCTLYGEATPADVVTLLGASNIFLYTGTRGTNYSMAVLEAMAAACAIIATTEPRSNVRLLAEGRGYAIPAGQATAIADALTQALTHHSGLQQMGLLAQSYVAQHHSADALKRCLWRAMPWAPDIKALAQEAVATAQVGLRSEPV